MLRMRNKQNGSVSVHGNGTVNLLVLVLRTRLRSSHEMLEHHMLNIFY